MESFSVSLMDLVDRVTLTDRQMGEKKIILSARSQTLLPSIYIYNKYIDALYAKSGNVADVP